MRKGYAFIRTKAQPDGGIYTKGLSNYNTSTALMALLNSGDPKDEPMLKAAKDFIVSQQAKGLTDPSLDGGISYGPTGTSRQHPDLDNHLVGLEALRAYQAARKTSRAKANNSTGRPRSSSSTAAKTCLRPTRKNGRAATSKTRAASCISPATARPAK